MKYVSLVASAVMLSNVVDLSEVFSVMAKEGQPVTAALAARISPYIRDHIRRFGRFALDMTQLPKTPAIRSRSHSKTPCDHFLYQPAYPMTALIQSCWVIEAICSGICMNLFQAFRQAARISS